MRAEYKKQAIALRRKGKTYREILTCVPVAKSTLSEWFKSVELATPQKQRITKARIAGALRGAEARRTKRLAEIQRLNLAGIKEVGTLSSRELWLVGSALHWAEGSKQRDSALSAGVIFTNSDPEMLIVFLAWLRQLSIPKSELVYELYVHASRATEATEFKRWWAKKLLISAKDFSAVYYKKGNVLTNRTNVVDLYHGQVRIKVRRSTSLNRQINGWIKGIVASV